MKPELLVAVYNDCTIYLTDCGAECLGGGGMKVYGNKIHLLSNAVSMGGHPINEMIYVTFSGIHFFKALYISHCKFILQVQDLFIAWARGSDTFEYNV